MGQFLSSVAFRHRKTGKVAESPKADVFRFRDGLIVEFAEFFDTARALADTHPDGPPAHPEGGTPNPALHLTGGARLVSLSP